MRPTLSAMAPVTARAPARREPVLLDVPLDRDSPVPLYHQVAAAIEAAITDGRLRPGDRLETELALTARLGLARPTVRQAIHELVARGLLARKQGVGTQVVHSQLRRDTRQMSLNDDLTSSGRNPSTRLLTWTTGAVEAGVRDALRGAQGASADAPEDTDFLLIRRLRLSDDVPIAILTNHLPARLGLRREAVEALGLYGALRDIDTVVGIAHQRVGARGLTAAEAELFGEDEGSPGLTIERSAFDGSGRFVEFGQHVYRASHHTLEMSIVG